jgi:uncharacterized coiled-coil protein SlyX
VVARIEDSVEERLALLESDLAHVRSDIGDMKLDIREMRAAIAALRDELRASISKLRDEMHAADGALLQAITEWRGEMRTALASQSKVIEHSTRVSQIWTVMVAAALLGVMARGFGWI